MGLTIHYELALRPETPDLDDLRARWAVEEARRLALKMKRRGAFDEVGPLRWDELARARTLEWITRPVPGRPNASTGAEVPAERGQIFRIGVGRDCEPLWLGLCRYPASVRVTGRELRVRLRKGAAWRLAGFSKTQYASLHGWEHFRRCHTAIVDFLAALRPLGFDVKISDEGGFWPRRSERTLREKLDQMNRIGAAFAGAMKDANQGEGAIQSPIFTHPQFERLEAEGVANRPDVAHAVRRIAGEFMDSK